MLVIITPSSQEFRVLHSETQTLLHTRACNECTKATPTSSEHVCNNDSIPRNSTPAKKTAKSQKRRAIPKIFQIETESCIDYLKKFPSRLKANSCSRSPVLLAPLSHAARCSRSSQLRSSKKGQKRQLAGIVAVSAILHAHTHPVDMASDDADFAAAIAMSLADSSSPCSNAAHVKLPEGSNPHVLIHN